MQDSTKGLTQSEARKRLKKFGPNKLPEKPPPSSLSVLLSQLKNPLVYVLIAAGVITLLLGDIPDTVIIFLAVAVNTILGFFQEQKANNALLALKRLIHPEATVIRNGKVKTIDVASVVPGDVVILSQGNKIPADGILIEADYMFAEEAILTGESNAVAKKPDDPVYFGTIVSAGSAKMLVEKTGVETEIGKIAVSVSEVGEDTPLKRQLKNFSRQLVVLIVILIAIVFAIGVISGLDLIEIFTISVALAVSAIPEGLLVGLTVVLAIGMQRILKRRGLVRNLVSAETLGGVTVICTDKTGTLTKGKLDVVEAIGDVGALARQAVLANDLDDPIIIAAWNWGSAKIKNAKRLIGRYSRIDSIPFSSKTRYFAVLNKSDRGNIIYVNGAPEYLLNWSDLPAQEKQEIKNEIKKLARRGLRTMGLAYKSANKAKKSITEKDIKSGLTWNGLLSFSDPVRRGIGEQLAKTRKAGVRVIVITGDYHETALSVMREIGVEVADDEIILGTKLAKMDDRELKAVIKTTKLFARTTPDQKLRIVDALKANGEVVAMMGDGVNDAPALAKADIGIVVGDATDVAKETSDLILLNSSFATIVAAIEEGRGIFDNIRKIILYLMSDAFQGIIVVVGAIVLAATLIPGLPLPVTAAQILWINLVSDGFPDLALTIDPKREGAMSEPPRPPREPLVTNWMKILISLVSLTGGLIALAIFVYVYLDTGDVALSRSVAFAALGINSLVYVFSVRTLKQPFWIESPLDNKWLVLAVVAGFIFQIVPFIVSPVGEFFGIVALPVTYWFMVAGASALVFVVIEVSKIVFRHESLK